MTESADVQIAKKALAPYLKRIGYDDGLLTALENFAAAIRNEERRKMEAVLLAAWKEPNPSLELIGALGALNGVTR